mgnify:CR=1 FL=1
MTRSLQILRHYLRVKRAREFASREALEAWQHRKVVRHLHRILPKSRYLQARFGELPIESWAELPVMDKWEMMTHFDELNTVGVCKDEAFDIALRAEETRDFTPKIGEITVGLSSGTSAARGLFLTSPQEQAEWAGTVLAKTLPRFILTPQRIALFLRANSNLYDTVRSKRIQFEFFDLLQPCLLYTSDAADDP